MERNPLKIMHQSASSYKKNLRHPVNAGSVVSFRERLDSAENGPAARRQ
jgi:hypothetical protein